MCVKEKVSVRDGVCGDENYGEVYVYIVSFVDVLDELYDSELLLLSGGAGEVQCVEGLQFVWGGVVLLLELADESGDALGELCGLRGGCLHFGF
jgi:hypothetical protein